MKSNLALSNLSLYTAAPAQTRHPAPSIAQTSQRQTLQMLGQIWRSLSFAEKATWVAAAQQVNGRTPASRTAPPALTAYLTFIPNQDVNTSELAPYPYLSNSSGRLSGHFPAAAYRRNHSDTSQLAAT